MASFFGEVVFPVSRAFWDEEDEYGATQNSVNQPQFSVRWLKEKPPQIDTLVVIEGEMLIDFSKKCLCENSEELCLVEDDNQTKVCSLYQVNDNVYLCIVSPRFDTKFSAKLVDKMGETISSAKNTISVTCRHISQFKNKNTPTVPSFLRMLTTENGKNVCKLKEPYLEQPNIVYGVAAGVLSYAQFMELPSVLYVLYTDSFVLDSLSAEPLLKLFTAMNCTLHNVTFAGKDFFSKGNLYM
ncbi:Proteasome assembly chaperone 1 [Habropoda laboriosa]|uniref:Proteasome assembly chaperone 1 n=1 Tax=Habropoda laboriosa TaxID=597456 RepID=A0A0L7R1X6_9HYME|nr:PREDICTED: proteasome assembly chaperone 1 [Habropoda laboriosa]KOC64811.1 Proteasome assembly chaperone 1 [Habropoda laboriosa]